VELRLEETLEFEFVSHINDVGKGQIVVINLNVPHQMTSGL
jgi:mannose-6-phosphate isomerase-like protein (cupin superfamily)